MMSEIKSAIEFLYRRCRKAKNQGEGGGVLSAIVEHELDEHIVPGVAALESKVKGLEATLARVKQWHKGMTLDMSPSDYKGLGNILSSTPAPIAVVDGYLSQCALASCKGADKESITLGQRRVFPIDTPVTVIVLAKQEGDKHG